MIPTLLESGILAFFFVFGGDEYGEVVERNLRVMFSKVMKIYDSILNYNKKY